MEKRQVTGRFFKVFFNQGRDYHFAAVEAPDDKSHFDIPKQGYVENWAPILFTKKNDEGELADFISSDICDRICTSKLREIIDQNSTSSDMPIQWLPVTIAKEGTSETFNYFYLHFPEICDSLDEDETEFNRLGVPFRTCFSLEKIKGRSICNCRGSSSLLMSKDLRKAILEAECTGLKFEQTIVLEEYEEENPNSDKVINL